MPADATTSGRTTTHAQRATRLALAAAVLTIIGWYFVVLWARPTFVADERYHVPVIHDLARGMWDSSRALPMPPTYHLLASLPVRVLGGELWVIRGFNTLLAVLAILVFHAAAKAYHPDYGPGHLLRFAWHPLLLPLWALVYTDVASLLALLVALAFHVRRRTALAAIALLAACLMRQSNVVWAAFFAAWRVMEVLRSVSSGVRPQPWFARLDVRPAWRAAWPYVLVVLAGAAVFILRGATAPGSQAENRLHPNIAQLYVLGLSGALFWAPIWLADLRCFWSSSFKPALMRPSACAAVLAAIGALGLAFDNPHAWNANLEFVRNWPLYLMSRSLAARGVVALVIVACVAALVQATRLNPRRAILGLVWAFSLLYIVPHFLADPRYYVMTFVLVDFFTPYGPRQSRRLLAWYVLLTLGIGAFIVVQPHGWRGIW